MFLKKAHKICSFRLCAYFLLFAGAGKVFAIGDPNALDTDEPFSFMHLLAQHGWHDMEDEGWNVHGQASVVSQWKPAFPAAYTNLNGSPNSLLPQAERIVAGPAVGYGCLIVRKTHVDRMGWRDRKQLHIFGSRKGGFP